MTKREGLREQSKEELNEKLREISKEIYQLRNEFKVTSKIEKTHLIKEKKRERARIMTIIREQEIRALQAEGSL